MKKLLSHWHYGIKARVVDDALLVKLDTAVEPVLLRLDLSRVQANTLGVRAIEGDYELGLSGYKMDFVPLARFETRDAAEVAGSCVERALFRGGQPGRFRRALLASIGVVLGVFISISLGVVVLGAFGAKAPEMPMMTANPGLPSAASLQSMGMGTGQMDPAALQAAIQSLQSGAAGLPAGAGFGTPGAVPTAPSEPGVPMSADDFLRNAGQ